VLVAGIRQKQTLGSLVSLFGLLVLFCATSTCFSESNKAGVCPIKHCIFVNMISVAGNTKGGSITVPLTSCLTGLESAV